MQLCVRARVSRIYSRGKAAGFRRWTKLCSCRAPVRPQCNATAKAVARLFTARPGSLSPLHRARHGPVSAQPKVGRSCISRLASHVYSHDAWRNCCGGIVYCIYMGSATTDERGARVVASVGTVVANALAWCSGWCGLGAGWSWPWVTLPVLRCLPAWKWKVKHYCLDACLLRAGEGRGKNS